MQSHLKSYRMILGLFFTVMVLLWVFVHNAPVCVVASTLDYV